MLKLSSKFAIQLWSFQLNKLICFRFMKSLFEIILILYSLHTFVYKGTLLLLNSERNLSDIKRTEVFCCCYFVGCFFFSLLHVSTWVNISKSITYSFGTMFYYWTIFEFCLILNLFSLGIWGFLVVSFVGFFLTVHLQSQYLCLIFQVFLILHYIKLFLLVYLMVFFFLNCHLSFNSSFFRLSSYITHSAS